MPTSAKRLIAAARPGGARDPLAGLQAQAFDDVLAAAQQRVERGERVLEQQRHPVAAVRRARPRRQGVELACRRT